MSECKRAIAAKQNGRLGGLRTAKTSTQEFLEDRARSAGSSTRDRYGIEYYRYIATKFIRKPQLHKQRKAVQAAIQSVVA